MAAPTNTTSDTATDIGSLPYKADQTVDDAGTTYTVWYKYTAELNDHVIGLWFYGNLVTDDNVYRPTTRVYTIPIDVTVGYPVSSPISALRVPFQIPVSRGTTYYFEVIPNGGNPTPAILSIDALRAPNDSAPLGSILINNDNPNFPTVILDSDTGDVLQFVNAIPSGEAGDVLDDGTIAISDLDKDTIVIMDGQFNVINTLSIGDVGPSGPQIRANRGDQTFYYGYSASPVKVRNITRDGKFGNINQSITGFTTILGIAASNDGTILYFSDNLAGSPIRRWDLVNQLILTNLYAGISGSFIHDILVLGDGTIVASFTDHATNTSRITRFDSLGSILVVFDTGIIAFPDETRPRLAYAVDDPNSFWLWSHVEERVTGISKFQEIRSKDGIIIRSVTSTEYRKGIYYFSNTTNPRARFGNPVSCPFIITRRSSNILYSNISPITEFPIISSVIPGASTAGLAIMGASSPAIPPVPSNGLGGLYRLVPGKVNDTIWVSFSPKLTFDTKIPDPFIKTAFLGE